VKCPEPSAIKTGAFLMRLLKLIKSDETKYVIMAVEINNYERRVVASLIADVCEYEDRRINLQNLMMQLNAIMSLYPSEIKLPSQGCQVFLFADPYFWSFVFSLCKRKGLPDEEICAQHVIEIISEFLSIINAYMLAVR
jgi:hypothetical protein